MRGLACVPMLLVLTGPVAAQAPEKQVIITISGKDLRAGVVSEIAWDGGTVIVQGVFAQPGGELAAQYFVKPAESISVERRAAHTDGSLRYWQMKSSRVSPTGLGRINITSDTKLPMYGIGSLEQRVGEAVDMGGTQTTHVVRAGDLIMLERISPVVPYDGETWSWSPPELNRIAYVDGKGDLWVAGADGRSARRILRGKFSLPAWSEDGRLIAVAERKGDRWEISLVHLPADLRTADKHRP
jgi:hypothetical protein